MIVLLLITPRKVQSVVSAFNSSLHSYNHRDNTVSIQSNKNARTSLLPFPHKKLAYLLKHNYLYCSRYHLAQHNIPSWTTQDGILSSKAKGVPVLKVISSKCHVPMLLTLRSIDTFRIACWATKRYTQEPLRSETLECERTQPQNTPEDEAREIDTATGWKPMKEMKVQNGMIIHTNHA